MCLYIKPHTRRRIAKRDIPVFKVLRRVGINLCSPYQDVRYEQGKTKRVKLQHEPSHKYQWWRARNIDIGLHAFVNKTNAEDLARKVQGLSTAAAVLVDMIVPKGSAYYLGTNGDIVSSRLKFTGRSE